VVSKAVVPVVCARVYSLYVSYRYRCQNRRKKERWRSQERVPDSFHFSFNRIVTVVFVVNIVVLLCKYNINSNADKRFGNAIKNEKRCFFHSCFFYSDLSWTASDFCRPTWYIICAAVYLYSAIRIYSRWDDRKRRKTRSVTSTQFKPLSS
jgi:hypothetical protein